MKTLLMRNGLWPENSPKTYTQLHSEPDALPLLPERRYPRDRLARVRRRRHDPPASRMPSLRRAFLHAGDGGTEAAGDREERRPPRGLRRAQAAQRFRSRAAQAPGAGGADRGRGARGGAAIACFTGTRAAVATDRRTGDGGTAQARSRRLR